MLRDRKGSAHRRRTFARGLFIYKNPDRIFIMHKSQVFGYLLVSFLLGIFVGGFFENVTLWTLVFVLIGTVILVVSAYERTFARTLKAERNRRIGVIAGACVLALALGVFRYGQANLNNSVLLQFADLQAGGKGIEVVLRGTVDNEMEVDGDRGQLVLHVHELEVPGHIMKVDERTLLFTKAEPIYVIGDKISVTGALQRPENFAEDFDYIQYLKNKGIRTTVPSPTIVLDASIDVPTFRRGKLAAYRSLFGIKDDFQSAVRRSLPEPYAAYINGILVGTRQNIPDDLAEAFNKTGTTHILAISGYNIAIIAQALLAAMVFFIRRRKAFWISVAIIILFTILTGASASVVRASVMGLLLLFANGYGRLYDPRNSILLAAALMVFIHPLSLRFDVGFQLSFLAVLGLVYLYPLLESKFSRLPEWKGVKEILLMSIAAQVMVAPLLAYVFHTFSLVSLPANILILPLMPFVMLFGFLAGLAGLIFVPLGMAIGLLAFAISYYQLNIVVWMASLPFSSLMIRLPLVMLVLMYALIVLGIWRTYLTKQHAG